MENEKESIIRYKATVKMVKEWSDFWSRKPSRNNVLEALADEILRGNIEDFFDITIEKVETDEKGLQGFGRKASVSSKECGLHQNKR